jgi:hypothetical protein
VAVAQSELEVLALGLDAVARAHDLELLRVALSHADDQVLDQRAGEAVQRPRLALLVRTGHRDGAVLQGGGDRGRDDERQLALGALHTDVLAVDGDVDAGGDGDGVLADA